MFGKSYELFRVFGLPIRIDLSWLIIVFLVAWSLGTGWFPGQAGGLSQAAYWSLGLAGALLLFASVVVHELSHALVARQQGLPMQGITLFLFGGVAQMSGQPPSAKAEFLVAIAGPAMTVVVTAAGFGLLALSGSLGWPAWLDAVIRYVAVINLVLLGFNLLPAFPLDGGRVLRSALWKWKGDLTGATRTASRIGGFFGLLLVGLGILDFFTGNMVGGMWLVLIGFFLRSAAKGAYRQLQVRQLLSDQPVRDFMDTDPVSVPDNYSIKQLVNAYMRRHRIERFPVTDEQGHLLGCYTREQVQEIPQDRWESQRAGDEPPECDPDLMISPDADAASALEKMSTGRNRRLLAVDEEGVLRGVIDARDLAEYFRTASQLGTTGSKESSQTSQESKHE